ncbi:hypothetical protein EDB85DRAFT_1895160 [Lactarius pseudohatsudake]|nr:hypothetical protein EDB85DRAFT_1895160 [Lactarius pseudohatsudake]
MQYRKSPKSKVAACLGYYHNALAYRFTYYHYPPYLASLHLIIVPSRQMKTWARNQTTHPGNIDKGQQRCSTAVVQRERMAKAQAKEDRRLATKRSIEGVAEFESGDMVSEDEFNASPRPAFTSEAQPSSPQSRTNIFPRPYGPRGEGGFKGVLAYFSQTGANRVLISIGLLEDLDKLNRLGPLNTFGLHLASIDIHGTMWARE